MSGVRLRRRRVCFRAEGLIYSVLAACRGRLRGTAAAAAAGARHYWLGSTGWDQPIQSTSELRPIGPPELQNPTALLHSSAKKKEYFSFPRQMFSKRKFKISGGKRLVESKYHEWLLCNHCNHRIVLVVTVLFRLKTTVCIVIVFLIVLASEYQPRYSVRRSFPGFFNGLIQSGLGLKWDLPYIPVSRFIRQLTEVFYRRDATLVQMLRHDHCAVE